MSDWPGWAALIVSLGTLSRAEHLRHQSNVANRNALVDDVLSTYDSSDLFKADLPDFDARGLVAAANRWKEQCRLAQLSVNGLSSANRDLATCITKAKDFRNDVTRIILAKNPGKPDEPLYVYEEERDELKKLIGDLVSAVEPPIKRLRPPRPRRFGRPGS